jgi:hypothetical protein
MRETSEQKRWRLVLDDAESPEPLKAEARRALGIEPESTPHILEYSPQMDSLVEFYWNRRKPELEEWDPTAEKVYSLLVDYLVLGGNESFPVAEDAETLLFVFKVCRSPWMRRRVSRALLAIRLFDRDRLPVDVRRSIEETLTSITDFDPVKPDGLDFLSLIQMSQHTNTTHTTEQTNLGEHSANCN